MESEVPTSGRELNSREIPLSQDFNRQIHNIDDKEMNYYSSFIIPTFTLILIISCLVVALYSAQDFEDSLIPPYLVAAAVIMGLDLLMMIFQSVINKISNQNNDDEPSGNSLRSKTIPKIILIILFLGYFSLIIVGSLTFTVFNDSEITSKDNASLSVTFFAVYCFIVVRAMMEILSFIILWLLNATRNVESNLSSRKYETSRTIEINTNAEASPANAYNGSCQFFSSQGDEDKTPTFDNTDNQNRDEVKTSTLPELTNIRNKGNFKPVDISEIEESKELYFKTEVLVSHKQKNISLGNKMHRKKSKKVGNFEKAVEKFKLNKIHSGGYTAVETESPLNGQYKAEEEINHAGQESLSFKYFKRADEDYILNKSVFDANPKSDLSSFNPNNQSI